MTSTPSSLPTPADEGGDDKVGKKLLATTDAEVWATEFVTMFAGALIGTPTGNVNSGQVYLGVDDMLTWFASAIETGRSAGRKELCPHTDTFELAPDLWCCRDCGFLIQPVDLGDKFVEGFQEGRA
jgi:hypothetical protein